MYTCAVIRSLQDLLRPESENLQIRENEGGVFVGGVHQQEVRLMGGGGQGAGGRVGVQATSWLR